MVKVTLEIPWILHERMKCVAAFRECTFQEYAMDNLSAMVRTDEGDAATEEIGTALSRYFDKGGLPADHPFRAIHDIWPCFNISALEKVSPFNPAN